MGHRMGHSRPESRVTRGWRAGTVQLRLPRFGWCVHHPCAATATLPASTDALQMPLMWRGMICLYSENRTKLWQKACACYRMNRRVPDRYEIVSRARPAAMDEQERHKITILLTEYNTLRAEIIARIGHLYQMMGYAITAIILLTTLGYSSRAFWPLLVLIVVTFLIGLWYYLRYVLICGTRIREIELDVNDRAQEDLLVWENLWAAGATGLSGTGTQLPRSHLAKVARPIRTRRGVSIEPEPPQPN